MPQREMGRAAARRLARELGMRRGRDKRGRRSAFRTAPEATAPATNALVRESGGRREERTPSGLTVVRSLIAPSRQAR